MALEDYTAKQQQFITLFATVLNKAPTPDLIDAAGYYLDNGLSQGDLLQILFDNANIPYAGYKEAATTNAFLTQLISNLAAGSGISTTVQAQWAAGLAADYGVYSANGYSKGEFAAKLVEVLQSTTFPANSDLAKLAANIDAKADSAAIAYTGDVEFTTWNALVTPPVEEQPNDGDTIRIGVQAGVYDYVGGSGDDTFRALILDNQNTFVSGVAIDGKGGYDTLYAEIGNSQEFSITPWLTNVEKVQIRVQAVHSDQADNNVGGATLLDTAAQLIEALIKSNFASSGFVPGIGNGAEGPLVPVTYVDQIEAILSSYLLANFRGTQVDAEQTSGVLHWESKNSRSDLLIEDVRILDNQITKDITIAFVDSDPGNVDFAVYFDQQSLRKAGGTEEGATLVLEILDTRAAVAGQAPLLNNPFNGFGIKIDGGDTILVRSEAIDAAQTYPELLAAIQAAVAANPALANFEVSLGNQFNAVDTLSGIPVTGTQIVLTNKGEGTVTGAGWVTADGVVPPSTGLHLVQENTQPIPEGALITSTVILDNVGRGSTGGDLVIGGLSVGDTSRSKGVEQFDITVEQSSKLQTIASTNNSLEVVNLKSGATYTDWVDGLPVVRYGNLTVLGSIDSLGSAVFDFDKFGNAHKFTNLVTAGDLPLPGHAVEELLGFGFTDVRVINAADFGGEAFKGDIDVSLILTDRVVEKYLDRTDTQADPAGDNVEFSYEFGDGNDRFAIAIDSENLVRGGTTTHEDFELTIDGGKGNDIIKAVIGYVPETDEGVFPNWYENSKLNANLQIFGGEGDDEVHTIASGDWLVDLGAGNDTWYGDNTGAKSIWVRNDNFEAGGTDVDDLLSYPNEVVGLYKAQLSVTLTTNYNGDEDSYTSLRVDIPSTNYGTSDLQINQAIKAAINSDPVLSKLLVAEDGPANTLVISSLIDGASQSLDFAIHVPTSLTASEWTGYNNAHNLGGVGQTGALAAIQAAFELFRDGDGGLVHNGDNGFGQWEGSDSSSQVADNTVIGGLGNDVLVLGTGTYSNDTVKYVGLGNGYDTIVNFVTGTGTIEQEEVVGVAAVTESFKVALSDLVIADVNAETTLTFGGTVVTLDNGTPSASLIPGKDVAYAFFLEAGGVAGEPQTAGTVTDANGQDWDVSWVPGTNELTFVSATANTNVDNVVAGDFVYANATGTAAISEYVEGLEAYSEGSAAAFAIDLNGSIVINNGDFTFDGVTVAYVAGDGPIQLTDKLAAANFPNWTVTDNNDGTVTFTAKEVGAQDLLTLAADTAAANPDLTTDGIQESTSIVNPGADEAGESTTEIVTLPNDPGADFLDFSSYAGVDHVVVVNHDGTLVVGDTALPTASDVYVRLTENTTTNPGEGVYTIELVTLNAAGAATAELIGVADFGAHKDFLAENFIV